MSTLEAPPRRSRNAFVALVTSFLIVMSGLVAAPAAYAEPAAPALSATEAPRDGGTITVTGSGFDATEGSVGVYVGIGAAGHDGFYADGNNVSQPVWVAPGISDGVMGANRTAPMQADGTFTITFEMAAYTEGASFAVYASKTHTIGETDLSQNAITTIAYEVEAPQVAVPTTTTLAVTPASAKPGDAVTFTATVEPATAQGTVAIIETIEGIPGELGNVAVSEGIAAFTTATLNDGTHSNIIAKFTPMDEAAYVGSESAPVTVNVVAPQASLKLTSSSTSVSDGHVVGLSGALDTAIALDNANDVTVGTVQFTRNGVAFGKPKPATVKAGKKSVSFTEVSSVINDGDVADFAAVFTPNDDTTLLVATSNSVTVTGTASTGAWAPEIKVFLKADGVETPYTNQKVHEGDELIVRGTGFDPEANVGGRGVPVPFGPQGTYVVFGNFDSTGWEPSKNAPSANRKTTNQGWILAESVLNTVPSMYQGAVRAQWVKPENGAFQWSSGPLETPESVANGEFGIYTYAAGGAVNAAEERKVLVNYVVEEPPVEPETPATGDLNWAFNTGWNFYAKNIAKATISGANGATVDESGNAQYTQVDGGNFSAKTGLGSIHYQGTVTYASTDHGFNIAIKDPQITFTTKTSAVLTVEVSDSETSGASQMSRIPFATLTAGAPTTGTDGILSWSDVTGVFATPLQPGDWGQYEGKPTAPLAFTFGAGSDVETPTPVVPPVKPTPKPEPAPAPKPVAPSQQAGSLAWGVSSAFAAYTTGPISKGSVTTAGVGSAGGAYLFPQAGGGSWNAEAQTGSVQFSGVVTFTAHHGFMSETFANPVITVNSADSATLVAGGRTFTLNLAAASKTVGAQGEVTWSGVPVSGLISGGGDAGDGVGSGSFAPDALSFTVGAASTVQFGTTSQSNEPTEREAAATPPATTGISVITPKDKLVPGGEIEFEAAGFEANERDILVVLYSDPIVLDRKAGADASGNVRWIGKLPADLEPGTHTITLQGSTNAGAVIEVGAPGEVKRGAEVLEATADTSGVAVASGVAATNAGPVWLWWVGAGALLLLAAALGGLVVNQRRTAAAATAAGTSGNVDSSGAK